MSTSLLTITSAEEPRLRQVMKDIQNDVAAYYAATAGGGDLGVHARTWLGRVQNLNDLLTKQLHDKATYLALFTPTPTTGAELINAVKYARNVDQHLMFEVSPSEDVFIGGAHGMRTYGCWRPIPAATHAELEKRTQRLQPAYQANLEGKELTSTMLAVLRFFADIAPQIVHRDHRGEWTGFPLKSQPAVGDPLHPEEPVGDIVAANVWLNRRRPNGDLRVVVGQFSMEEAPYLVGFTFADQLSFSPFVETPEQVDRDIAAGFTYLQGDVSANVENVTHKFPMPPDGAVLYSPKEATTWATPLTQTRYEADWMIGFDPNNWRQAVSVEHPDRFPDFVAYEQRRAFRLYAQVPPR
ncbi:hypothetical protein [Gordonia otitidis]|uniref:Uncharacterized protein n=1 Tax=Gordonia otitidis (strain DSM 44809 / CCUG 52243 / JCM 12355 / NBRC 100426 / IFM 10032) TaxID=1108044 RepID=H5TIP8_GORO1|nr:hypothetical protein [Gordonia otitidis]GAB33356.1 hypothetical protein GOOTI_063_00270 [Gordonia otitidis NBRC 100426]